MGIFDKFKKSSSATASPEQADVDSSSASAAPADEPAKTGGVFGRLKQGLKKTHQILFTDVRDLFKKEGRLVDDEFLEELRAVLIKTDMGPAAAEQIASQIGGDFRARVVQMGEVIDIKAPGQLKRT